MKAEDFVKQHYPDAKAVNTGSCYGFANKHLYTYIIATNKIGMRVHLSDGKTESNAWVNAKKAIQSNGAS